VVVPLDKQLLLQVQQLRSEFGAGALSLSDGGALQGQPRRQANRRDPLLRLEFAQQRQGLAAANS